MAPLLPRLRHQGRKIPVLRDDAELLHSWTWLPPCFIRLTPALNGASKRAKPRLRASVFERVVRTHSTIIANCTRKFCRTRICAGANGALRYGSIRISFHVPSWGKRNTYFGSSVA